MICDDTYGSHWAMLSNGDGKFKTDAGKFKEGWCGHTGYDVNTSYPDFNGDGKHDLHCDDNGNHWSILSMPAAEPKRAAVKEIAEPFFKLGKEIGQFKSGWCSHNGSQTSWADVNGDGMDDMICDDTQGSHWVMLSNGDGKMTDLGQIQTGWCSHAGSYT